MNRSTNQKKHQSGKSSSKCRNWKIEPSIPLGQKSRAAASGRNLITPNPAPDVLTLTCCILNLDYKVAFRSTWVKSLNGTKTFAHMPNFTAPIVGKRQIHVMFFHKIQVTGVTYNDRLTTTARCGARPGRCAHWPNGPVPHCLCWVPATGFSPNVSSELLGKMAWEILGKIWDAKMARPSHHPCMFCQIICPLKLLPVWKHLKNAQRDVHGSMTGQPNNWT